VKRAETIEMGMSVDAALRYIVSMGVAAPAAKISAAAYPGD
jgi:uncharacterized membrane protein